jgi:hypothetical protein
MLGFSISRYVSIGIKKHRTTKRSWRYALSTYLSVNAVFDP